MVLRKVNGSPNMCQFPDKFLNRFFYLPVIRRTGGAPDNGQVHMFSVFCKVFCKCDFILPEGFSYSSAKEITHNSLLEISFGHRDQKSYGRQVRAAFGNRIQCTEPVQSYMIACGKKIIDWLNAAKSFTLCERSLTCCLC